MAADFGRLISIIIMFNLGKKHKNILRQFLVRIFIVQFNRYIDNKAVKAQGHEIGRPEFEILILLFTNYISLK